jgi:uncharacterized protein YecT (DUF1311 family)
MKTIRIALLALSLGAASCATIANDAPDTAPPIGKLERPSYHQCLGQAKGRLAQGRCIASEKAGQLEALDRLYKRLESKLKEQQRTELANAQTAWKAFLDAENRLAVSLYDTMGGSSDLSVSTNQILWIVQRRQQLQRHLDAME